MGNADESRYARELSRGFPTLRFQQPLESEFRAYYLAQNAPRLRITLTIAVGFLLTLAVLDWRLTSRDIQLHSLGIRLAALPALLLALAATRPGVLAGHLDRLAPSAGAGMIVSVFAVSWMSLSAGLESAVSVPIAATVFVYLCLGLRLSTAVCLGLPLFAGYLVAGLGYQLPAGRLAFDLVSLSFGNVCGAYGCYRLEHASRTSFLEREIVNILAGSDAGTGIPNRRIFNANLQRAWRQAMRESRGLAVALVEIDHLRNYAARYGQEAANAAFRRVAHTIMGCARRPLDVAARFSEQEFSMLLYDPGGEHVEKLAGTIRDRVALLDIPHGASPTSPRLTLSIGFAILPAGGRDDPKSLLELADAALEEARLKGGNAVIIRNASAESSRVLRGPWNLSQSPP